MPGPDRGIPARQTSVRHLETACLSKQLPKETTYLMYLRLHKKVYSAGMLKLVCSSDCELL